MSPWLRCLGDKGKEAARGIGALVSKIAPAPKADDDIRTGAVVSSPEALALLVVLKLPL
jgi:hypothetical protein